MTPKEQVFVTEYIRTSSPVKAAKKAGMRCGDDLAINASKLLRQPNVKAEIDRIMEEIREDGIAEASEVMRYLTSVMRGEVKDQFGLDAPLAERTRAAQELAKRTIDIDNKKNGVPDQTIAIKLDWNRG